MCSNIVLDFRTGAYCGEDRFHARIRKGDNLTLRCPISYVDIPARTRDEDGNYTYSVVPWPWINPKDMVIALIDGGHEWVFGDNKARSDYWNEMCKDYEMVLDRKHAVPLALYGDECTCFRQSIMCLHWQCEVHPQSTDAIMSRFCIALIPAENYWTVPCLVKY